MRRISDAAFATSLNLKPNLNFFGGNHNESHLLPVIHSVAPRPGRGTQAD